jgi:hypothetical protein
VLLNHRRLQADEFIGRDLQAEREAGGRMPIAGVACPRRR